MSKKCPNCGNDIIEGLNYCVICENAKQNVLQNSINGNEKSEYCKMCGNKIENGMIFCPNCGNNIAINTSTNQSVVINEEQTAKGKKLFKITLITYILPYLSTIFLTISSFVASYSESLQVIISYIYMIITSIASIAKLSSYVTCVYGYINYKQEKGFKILLILQIVEFIVGIISLVILFYFIYELIQSCS